MSTSTALVQPPQPEWILYFVKGMPQCERVLGKVEMLSDHVRALVRAEEITEELQRQPAFQQQHIEYVPTLYDVKRSLPLAGSEALKQIDSLHQSDRDRTAATLSSQAKEIERLLSLPKSSNQQLVATQNRLGPNSSVASELVLTRLDELVKEMRALSSHVYSVSGGLQQAAASLSLSPVGLAVPGSGNLGLSRQQTQPQQTLYIDKPVTPATQDEVLQRVIEQRKAQLQAFHTKLGKPASYKDEQFDDKESAFYDDLFEHDDDNDDESEENDSKSPTTDADLDDPFLI